MEKTVLKACIVIVAIPVVLAVCVSSSVFRLVAGGNSWIDFWGSYLGAIIGGLIALYVLFKTLNHEMKKEKREEKQKTCDLLINETCLLIALHREVVNSSNTDRFKDVCIQFWAKHSYIKMKLECIEKGQDYVKVNEVLNKLEYFVSAVEPYIDKVLEAEKEKIVMVNAVEMRTKSYALLTELKNFVIENTSA